MKINNEAREDPKKLALLREWLTDSLKAPNYQEPYILHNKRTVLKLTIPALVNVLLASIPETTRMDFKRMISRSREKN